MKNFCGISLMSVAAKVYNRILLNRIYDPIDKLLWPYQAGFKKNRNSLEQIHVLTRVMEAHYQSQLPLTAVFTDFKKAFDSIDREMMSKILRNYGIPKRIVNVIAVTYIIIKNRVRLGEKLKEVFHITTDFLQGDTLAPLLFIIILDYILKQTDPNHGIKAHLLDSDVSLPNFADDIFSFDSNETAAGEHLQNLQKETAAVGLKINSDKTKIFLVNFPFSNQLPTSLENLEILEDFKYFGAKIASSYDDFKRKRGITWIHFWKLEKV